MALSMEAANRGHIRKTRVALLLVVGVAGPALSYTHVSTVAQPPEGRQEDRTSSQKRTATNDKMAAWDAPLRGAVYGGYYGDGVAADLDAAGAYGIRLVRLFFPGSISSDQTLNLPGAMTAADLNDFDSEYFNSPRFEEALRTLDSTIDAAAGRGMKVVISPGLVPGSHGKGPVRWRLFRRHRWHWEFAHFWKRLAKRYRDHSAVIGYLLFNEPGFEVTQDLDFTDRDAMDAYYRRVAGTPADLNLLYRRTVAEIRAVDPATPIVVQPGQWGRPQGLRYLEPLPDENIVYCIHWYGPWLYTTWRMNRGRWAYPGAAPENTAGDADHPGALQDWDLARLREKVAGPVRAWRKRHGIASNRIYVGEFGADRRVAGSERWLGDMIRVIEGEGWHWTYYMFREREWNAMDQELGARSGDVARSGETPGMQVIVKGLRGRGG